LRENSAAPETKRSPPPRAVERGAEQKNFLFLLEEKTGARKIKKCKENFSARQCRFAAQRQGGAIGFFQEFLIK